MTVDADIPDDTTAYRHDPTDDLVHYVGRSDGRYVFSINGGDRTLKLRTEDWPDYSEQLSREGGSR